jgi:hypothetical protein
MRGNGIIVSSEARGVFKSCKLNAAAYPGSLMTPVPNTAVDANGLETMELAGTTANSVLAADGGIVPIAILMDNSKQGFDAHTQIPVGTVAEVYYPVMGEELNILGTDQVGTATLIVQGQTQLIADFTNKGRFKPTTGTPASKPFMALESVVDPMTATLVWCRYTGA